MTKKGNSHTVETNRSEADIVPEGTYLFRVIEEEDREGPAGAYWNFTCEVHRGPFKGQRVWTIVSLAEKARWKLDQWLDAFAIPEETKIDGAAFVGLTFQGRIFHDEYEGKLTPKFDRFLEGSSAGVTSAPQGKKGKKGKKGKSKNPKGLPADVVKKAKFKRPF